MELYKGIDKNVEQLLDMVFAPIYSKICMTAIEMDIFTLLVEPQTAETLAEKQGWHAINAELFLNAAAGLGERTWLIPQYTGSRQTFSTRQAQKAEDRVQFMAGNYLTDDIGSHYDIVLAIGTLNFAK